MSRIVAITVTGRPAATDFMNMPDDPFTLNVEACGLVVSFKKVAVTRGFPCAVSGSIASIESSTDDAVPSSLEHAIRRHLAIATDPVVHVISTIDNASLVDWSGGQLPGSRTFALRDFCRRVITAIEFATLSTVAA